MSFDYLFIANMVTSGIHVLVINKFINKVICEILDKDMIANLILFRGNLDNSDVDIF